VFADHLPSILHVALVGAGLLWPRMRRRRRKRKRMLLNCSPEDDTIP